MTRKLLIVMASLSLLACSSLQRREELLASDLAALQATVAEELRPRLLSNGLEYCLELADTEGARDQCALDLEESLWLSNQDKIRTKRFIDKVIERIHNDSKKCKIWSRCVVTDL